MAMVVALFPASDEEPSIEPAALEELARLGVTSIAILRDASTAALVLEGWALDPMEAARAVAAVTGAGARTLRPLAQMALSTAAAPIAEQEE